MKGRLLLVAATLSLLAGCGRPLPLPTDTPSAAIARIASDRPILPGSKGDRNHLAALEPGQIRLREPITPRTTAAWLIAERYQRQKGAPLQALSQAEVQAIAALPECEVLSQQIQDLYRASKGTSDFAKSEPFLNLINNAVSQADERVTRARETASSASQGPEAPAPAASASSGAASASASSAPGQPSDAGPPAQAG